MNPVERSLRRAAQDLDRLGVRWAVIGALAMAVRSEPRFTRDVDIAVSVRDDREAEGLVGALLSSGYRSLALIEQEGKGRLATVRLRPAGPEADAAIVDLLFASSERTAAIT